RLGLRSDDAGHVIGNRLGGLGTVEWNIFPQNPNFNRGAYSNYVEQVLADAVRRYGSIEVWFRFHYDNPLLPNR
ncbi:DNA/RNA non-specific endonuclease, partial [Staphylococcus aureus]|uniref:DNA/RNA non-specific endonuclease n=1 Tax=Staphylococcus aureus TaxID=1280 RepID=UPI0034D976F1